MRRSLGLTEILPFSRPVLLVRIRTLGWRGALVSLQAGKEDFHGDLSTSLKPTYSHLYSSIFPFRTLPNSLAHPNVYNAIAQKNKKNHKQTKTLCQLLMYNLMLLVGV
jgi:hypothetical protein